MGLVVVPDLRDRRAPASPEEIAAFEVDVLAGFVLARASAGLADGTISSDVGHLEQVRSLKLTNDFDRWYPGFNHRPMPVHTPRRPGCRQAITVVIA